MRCRSRNSSHALAAHPSAEPEIQAVIGRVAARRAAILAVTGRADAALDRAWARAAQPGAEALSVAASNTPSLPAAEVRRLLDEETDVVVVDASRFEEFSTMSIPGGRSLPGGELVYRIRATSPPCQAMARLS
ncbi:hypothetical protein [Methylobacterium aquaticum]|uniref:Uncharacterized protein n=1 Tax=Methylobacterium aquaticum TaxID=270351 RepID=A0A0J6SDS5_9HYPH|nr:hypothetical protein [Methylobacterium aquaticum]KMO31809.1 hypothetical protein VP06_18880 [Methylobacterium aquaticum]